MASSNHRPIEILGVTVSARSEATVADWIERTLAAVGPVQQIATYNPEYAIAARHNPMFHDALRRCELVTADGVGITLAARLQKQTIERMTGVRLLELLAGTGAPLFLLGAGPGVADLAGERLKSTQPNTQIAGAWSDGTPAPERDAETIARIRKSGARIVAVAYGAPGQVLWIERNRAALSDAGVRIAIGVGGALDYWSGLTPTPPGLIRRFGIEWLWRLLREPRRWRRQLALPQFAILATIEALRSRLGKALGLEVRG
ncbi:MAG: WecB/TagA/CpsF family glycosyltransferase [Thermomicrobiales bacterium]|nr:WecB/TagA/CpsF family glycosyltransferase [Thermomicrobiales bacterium]